MRTRASGAMPTPGDGWRNRECYLTRSFVLAKASARRAAAFAIRTLDSIIFIPGYRTGTREQHEKNARTRSVPAQGRGARRGREARSESGRRFDASLLRARAPNHSYESRQLQALMAAAGLGTTSPEGRAGPSRSAHRHPAAARSGRRRQRGQQQGRHRYARRGVRRLSDGRAVAAIAASVEILDTEQPGRHRRCSLPRAWRCDPTVPADYRGTREAFGQCLCRRRGTTGDDRHLRAASSSWLTPASRRLPKRACLTFARSRQRRAEFKDSA